MKYALIVAIVFAVGCSSPTSPTPMTVTPPVTIAPPVTSTPNPLLSDARFNASFYRQLVTDGLEHPPGVQPLRRWTRAPMIYIQTIDDRGATVESRVLDQTAAAIINTTGIWTGGSFGVAGLERGANTREGQAGWVTVKWSTSGVCGTTYGVGGEVTTIVMNHARPECTCGSFVTKHELGHAMGFYHTDQPSDLMFATPGAICEKALSEREIFHARVAYSQPLGSLDPF